MSTDENHAPELLPMLSRGKHRNPRKGACFMELASYLAGERWSDHPDCTHPLLAGVARLVNDYTSDEARPRLAGLIPSVIGLTSDDPHVDALIALRSATLALPVVSAERQRVMAVSVLVCERVLAELDGRPSGSVHDESRRVLEQVPHAAEWAQSFTGDLGTKLKGFRRRAAPHAVRCAVDGVARSCVPDPDDRLREILVAAIDVVAEWTGPRADRPHQLGGSAWTEACRLTGVAAGR
ncbi:MAG TPA: hypothetical protein VFR13_02660 [Jiangellaceae bacterium]|nr:hypothetical protein [Jiangellaceae bacterium]